MYGIDWLEEAYRKILEDKRDQFLVLMSLLPLARTPMDEKSGRWASNLMRDLRKMLYSLTPWDSELGSVRASYKGKVKSGTISVVLDDPRLKNDPLFRGAKVVK